jgi:hypothetical protein
MQRGGSRLVAVYPWVSGFLLRILRGFVSAEPRNRETWNFGTRNQEPRYTPSMRAVYVRVLVVEGAILLGLWYFGRLFT